MGFFSDLKDDLSQAVNELMTEEELEAALAGEKTSEKKEAVKAQGSPITSEELSDMLDKVEAISVENGLMESLESSLEPAEAPEVIAEVLPEEVKADAAEEILSGAEPEIQEEIIQVEPEIQEEVIQAEPEIQEEVIQVEPEIQEKVMQAESEILPEVMPETIEEGAVMEEVKEGQEVLTEEMKEALVAEENNTPQEGKGEEDKMDSQPKVVSDETAVVTEGMSIVGDISSAGSLELIGTVTGNIDILGKLNITGGIQGNSKAAEIYAEGARINGEINSQGSVKIGQSSVVIGNISANSAVIAGAVKGDIDVHGPVVLDTSAIVMGNIKSKSVQINNGAVIEGMCSQCYADVNPSSFFEEIKKKKDK